MDPGSIDWQDIEQALALGQQGALRQARHREPLVTDLARDMRWMQCFQKMASEFEPEGNYEEDLLEAFPSEYFPAPLRCTAPKVGRNESCPCGSGKKFKKCCGGR